MDYKKCCMSLIIIFLASIYPLKDAETSDVIAYIGDEKITVQEFEDILKASPNHTSLTKEQKLNLLTELINRRVFVRYAREKNIDKDPTVSYRINSAVEEILLDALYKKEIFPAIKYTDEDLKKYYNEHIDQYKVPEMITFSTISVSKYTSKGDDVNAEAAGFAGDIKKEMKEAVSDIREIKEEYSKKTALFIEPNNYRNFYRGTTGFGESNENLLFSLKQGEVITLDLPDKYIVARIIEKRPQSIEDFEKVKRGVERDLSAQETRRLTGEFFNTLKSRYGVNINASILDTTK